MPFEPQRAAQPGNGRHAFGKSLHGFPQSNLIIA
jgi:hypothetical protein